ncbi:MAG TPA: metallophosphoesterase [Gaiellaceae bacterium]|nr:metallophosphoesterase [Gaiellaceae bacterium]
MRIGVLRDLHCELEPAGSRWINVFEPEHLDERTDAALAWFSEARVELILLLGDVVQFANPSDLEHMFSRLATANVAPLATVGGNHDLRLGEEFADCARKHGIRLLHEEPLELVTGVGVDRGPAPPQYVGQLAGWGGEAGLVVVASHFPVLSEASRVAAAGLPYAGDLVNRLELVGRLQSDSRPKLILSGHIHARCSTHDGPLLQFTVGALIEPPFDATLVEIDGTSVRRTARRLGEIHVTDPVFAEDEELWQWTGDRWELQPLASSAASTRAVSQT